MSRIEGQINVEVPLLGEAEVEALRQITTTVGCESVVIVERLRAEARCIVRADTGRDEVEAWEVEADFVAYTGDDVKVGKQMLTVKGL